MELTLDQALQKGVEAHKAGQVQEADRLYTAILKAQPKHPDANHNMGVLAVGVGKVQEALPFFKTALEANPNTAQFWLSYIDALIKLERIADAKAVFDQAKRKGAKGDGFDQLEQRLKASNGVLSGATPISQEVEQVRSNILDNLKLDQALKLAKKKVKEGSLAEARRIYQNILTKFPKNKRAADGLNALAGGPVRKAPKLQDPPQDQLQSLVNLYSQGQLQQALAQAESLVEQFPKSVILFNIQGAVLKGLEQLDLSIEAYNKALAIKPDDFEAYNNMGVTLYDQGKLEEAIEVYNKALAIKPDNAEAYNNMGVAFKEQGKLEEAIEAYKKALTIKPDSTDTYNNMGSALKEKGKLDEAIESYKKSLARKPGNAEAYNNMGVTLQVQGKLEEAMEAYNKALALKPDFFEVFVNMGNILRDQGKLDEAIEAYKKSLALKPGNAEAYNNMGVTLQVQGKLQEAIEAYSKALAIKPDYPAAYNNMGSALKGVVFGKPSPSLQKKITSILDHKTYVRPMDISLAAISLLKFEPAIKELFQQQSQSKLNHSFLETIFTLSELPLLLKLMSICPLDDLELEKGLTDIRSCLLLSVLQLTVSTDVLLFQSALALQCFTNEYIYDQSDHEEKALRTLEARVIDTLSDGKQPSPQFILCLASYKVLNEYEWCDLLAVTSDIEEVFTRQVIEPNQEAHMKPDIPALQEITDTVSSKVQEQYEESPYPRWVNLSLRLEPAPISKIIEEIDLKKNNIRLSHLKINEVEAPDILIAGCGTGQHSIGTAARFKNSKVLAIDLSLSSLAYAKRKTEELGIQNIAYMQADILDLGKLDRQFDIVESAGVLHHMDEPMAGWRVLTDCLRTGGLMKIGLYSELARQHIVKMRKEIAQSGIGSSDIAMKSFRNSVINSDKDHHKQILISSDFYSLSTLRDLLFHVQEHRFTVPQIKDCLRELGLKFCGFEAIDIGQNFKLNNTGADDPYNLDKWHTYEEANPNTFGRMYQFWCQKIA